MINNNLEHQAQAIFENEFLSLRSLPDGWNQASLIDIADYLNGLAMQKYRPTVDETGICTCEFGCGCGGKYPSASDSVD